MIGGESLPGPKACPGGETDGTPERPRQPAHTLALEIGTCCSSAELLPPGECEYIGASVAW